MDRVFGQDSQWMFRDFKKNAGMPVERWLETLQELAGALDRWDASALMRLNPPVGQLADYYQHMQDLARGYEKDPEKLDEQLRIIRKWENEADQLEKALSLLLPS